MNGQRTPVPRTIAQIVADVEAQTVRFVRSNYIQPPPVPNPSLGTVLRITSMDLRRLIGAAAQGDPDALRLAAAFPATTVAKVASDA